MGIPGYTQSNKDRQKNFKYIDVIRKETRFNRQKKHN